MAEAQSFALGIPTEKAIALLIVCGETHAGMFQSLGEYTFICYSFFQYNIAQAKRSQFARELRWM